MKIKQIINNAKYLFFVTENIFFDKSPEAIKIFIINKRVKKVIKKAYKLPYYKNKWDSLNIDIKKIKTKDDLRMLPELEKAEVSNNYKQFLISEKGHKFYTSGSSGKPVTVVYSDNSLIKNLSFSFRQRKNIKKFGYKNKIFIVRPISDNQTSYKIESLLKQILWIPNRLKSSKNKYFSILNPINDLYNTIQKEKADIIGTYGSFVEEFYGYCKKNNLNPKYPKIFTYSSDICTEDTIKKLLTMGIIVVGTYNCVECQIIAYQKKPLNNYYIHNDAVAVLANQNSEALITPLYNDSMLLVNYKLGDKIELKNNVINKIVGRVDFIENLSGKRISSAIFDPAFIDGNTVSYQIIQKRNKHLLINVVCIKENDFYKQKIVSFFNKLDFKNTEVRFVKNLIREINGKVLLVKKE